VDNETIVGNAHISPDGKRVVFWTQSAGKSSCWIRQVSSNSVVKILGPIDQESAGSTFSPDGEFVYFSLNDKNQPVLYQIPVLGGAPRHVLDGVSSPVTFSPDGKQIAFVSDDLGKTSLKVANSDGSGAPRILATREQPEFFSVEGPSWSPDGKVIAVGNLTTSENSLNGSVAVIPVNGGAERAIASAKWIYVGRVVWLPDGTGLVTDQYANTLSTGTQLWFVSYPDGITRRITNDLNGYGTVSLGLASDANTIVTVQEDFSAPIFMTGPNEDAGHAKQISNGKYDGGACLATTPDGKIVYCEHSADANDIWIMNGDGSGKKQITNDEFLKSDAVVSNDGRYVVFATTRSGGKNIWRCDMDGNNLKQLTQGSVWDTKPAISPDGKWVVFHSPRSGKKALWKVSIDGGEPVQLTDKFSWSPTISPDGKLIAFFFFEDKAQTQTRLGLLPLDGGDIVKLFDLPAQAYPDGGLEWAPDGQSLTFVNERDASNIMSQPIAGGAPKPLTNFRSDRIFSFKWNPDGKHLVYSRGPFIDDVVLIKDFR
jgi:Periplasmic component of the Tol biopolymer transport system